MNFTKDFSGWWALSDSSVEVDDKEVQLYDKDVGAPLSFSYSCHSAILKNKNTTEPLQIQLEYNRLQMEPFASNPDQFAASFDCTPFFTIPIFMGLIMMCLFTAVLAFGVYAMMDIKTMDRFDDPRGKMISVPVAE